MSFLLPSVLWVSGRFHLGNITDCMSFLQKSEAKLDEILKEIKSLRELVSSQEKRIIKLEDQISKIGI